MKLKEIHRTATFAWSPCSSLPLLATGTVAGALDESFSNDSQLEVWAPDFMNKAEYGMGDSPENGPKASISTTSRFNRIAWGAPNTGRLRGVIAAGMENGELGLWDPDKMIETAGGGESLIIRNTTHQGPVRGLDFNPIQSNLLSSGAINGEIYIWDLKDPSKPYSPGTRSSKLDEITSLAWNRQVQYILASSSSTGYTVVWDLRNKREVVALAYGGATQGLNIMGAGGRKGMSDVAWHPDNATRLVTSSEDDASPVVMVWDLRNARAPEKILTGHEKGILSLSWCRQDADLLLSCGKDNRVLCWSPQTAEIIGQLPYAANWAFQAQWCPRNPDLLAAAYFDGTIGVHSIQTTNEAAEGQAPVPTPKPDGSDVFDVPGFARTAEPAFSLKQPPKWLRRPASASFGYGGRLVSVSNLQSAHGKTQSSVVHIRKVVTEPDIVARAKELKDAADGQNLNEFAQRKSVDAESRKVHDAASWKALTSLFKAESREELITLLGFSKADIAGQIAGAIEKIKSTATPTQAPAEELGPERTKPHGPPVVSFAEPEPEAEQEREHTPSEQSTSVASDHTDVAGAVDGESTTTAPSLFGDDVGTPQMDAEADFFSTMGTIRNAIPDHVQVPHHNYAHDSSVAATIGSRPSSVASEALKNNTFRIYPSEEDDIDRLVTKALVLGDFESAVTLCLATERFADAILLAVKGGPELLQRTQKTYFEKRTVKLPYLRLFQSIVTEDLDDIVQNADLQEWQEIFVVLCTFAKPDEFANLAEQLGQRLEFHANILKNAGATNAEELRRDATLTYLAAGRLEKVVNIWIEEMAEEEDRLLNGGDVKSSSRYSAHAHALQTFMEKVAIFRSAANYADGDLKAAPDPSAAYKLAALYERYYEYADLLATQGLLDEAVSFLKLIPEDYQSAGTVGLDLKTGRKRIFTAASKTKRTARTQSISSVSSIAARSQPSAYGYQSYSAQPAYSASSVSSKGPTYAPYNISGSVGTSQMTNPYAPASTNVPTQAAYQPSVPLQPSYSSGPYASPARGVQIAAPPPPVSSAPPPSGPPPPPKKRDNSGWNDAPVLDRRTPSSNVSARGTPITSPFPNATPPQSIPGSPMHGPLQSLPPPPRPGSASRGPPHDMHGPPSGQVRPPPAAQHGHPAPVGYASPPGRVISPPHPGQQTQPAPPPPRGHAQFAPPGRVLSPPQMQGPPAHGPPQGPYTPPPPRVHPVPPTGGSGVPGPYARATPPPSSFVGPGAPVTHQVNIGTQQQHAPRPAGPYAPPPSAARTSHVPPSAPVQPPPPSAEATLQGAPAGPIGVSRPGPARQGTAHPKYPPGDRSHIPETSRRSYEILVQALDHMKQTTPVQQKRMVDDTERRLHSLFDALNCETLSPLVVNQLNELTEVMASQDPHRREKALGLHADLLAQGSRTDDIGLWMSAVKLLIIRL